MKELITIYEAAESSGLSINDIFNSAITGEVNILTRLESNQYSIFDVEFSGNIEELDAWLDSSYIDNVHCLTKSSGFTELKKSPSDWWDDEPIITSENCDKRSLKERVKPNGQNVIYVNASISGVWRLTESYIKKCGTLGYNPRANFTHLQPYGELNNLNFLRLYSNDFEGCCKIDELYLTENDFNIIIEGALDGKRLINKKKYSYRSQKSAQIERHAANRERVLLAAISLYKRFPDECSKNPSRWGSLLWDKRFEYWGEVGGAPLSKDEIIRLLRKAVKPPLIK